LALVGTFVGTAHHQLLRHECKATPVRPDPPAVVRPVPGTVRARRWPAPARASTFATEEDADRFLAAVEAEVHGGTWFDPNAGEIRRDAHAPR
jgi:hypothetical protein